MKRRRRLELMRRAMLLKIARGLPRQWRKKVIARQVFGILKNSGLNSAFDRHAEEDRPDD